MATKKDANAHVSRKGKKHMNAGKEREEEKGWHGKEKEEQEADKIAISDLLLGGRVFYVLLVSIRACNTSSPKYKAEKA